VVLKFCINHFQYTSICNLLFSTLLQPTYWTFSAFHLIIHVCALYFFLSTSLFLSMKLRQPEIYFQYIQFLYHMVNLSDECISFYSISIKSYRYFSIHVFVWKRMVWGWLKRKHYISTTFDITRMFTIVYFPKIVKFCLFNTIKTFPFFSNLFVQFPV
jgi:hypothetical protein